jgi:hypothetical protein
VPLWADTARVLRAWFRELGNDGNGVAFPGVRGPGLSRDGVDHLLRRAVATAVAAWGQRRCRRMYCVTVQRCICSRLAWTWR